MRAIILLSLLLACSQSAWANWGASPTTNSKDCNDATSCNYTVTDTTGGNVLWAGVAGSGAGTTIPTINVPTSSLGNTFTCQAQTNVVTGIAGSTGYRFCCAPVTTGGTDTITGSISTTLDFAHFALADTGGSCTLDNSTTGSGTTSPVTSTSWSTTNATDIILSVAASDNSCGAFSSPKTGGVAMTGTTQPSCLSIGAFGAYLIVSSTQSSVTTVATGPAGDHMSIAAYAFKAGTGCTAFKPPSLTTVGTGCM